MTLPDLSTPAPQIARDPRWGRPLVVPPEGGSRVTYTRATTFVGVVEDTYNLARWQMRMVALGLDERPDLRLAVAAHRDDKAKLNTICEDAQEAAKAHAAATIGTGLHALTEQMDRGMEVRAPEEYRADLAAYAQATEELTAVYIEQFCVQDPLKVGGTPDRVVRYQGKRYIADLKTGSIEYGFLKIAAQLAMYARSRPYDPATDTRMDRHGAELDKGIIIHLPAGTGVCTLYWVDLLAGWELVRIARDLRDRRKLRFGQLCKELVPVPVAPLSLADQIKSCHDPDEVRSLWRANAHQWDDTLTELAKQRVAALQDVTLPIAEGDPA
jgi:hypothetical protein